MSKSEVARLREQIELEYQAAYHVLHAPTIAAPHAFINARLSRTQEHKEQLARLVGEQEATEMVIEVMEQAEEMSYEQQAHPVAAHQSATAL